jgi:hypothetical protein
MALRLGNSEKLKVILNGVVYHLDLYSNPIITNWIRLLSSDDYILRDSNGIYLTVMDDEFLDIANLYAGISSTTATAYISDDASNISEEACYIGGSELKVKLQGNHLIVEG